jgi:hypothetical protein
MIFFILVYVFDALPYYHIEVWGRANICKFGVTDIQLPDF